MRNRNLFFSGSQLDILLWGYAEMDRQLARAEEERAAIRHRNEFGVSNDLVSECPCGCGLKGDICEVRAETVKRINSEIPF